MVQKYVKNEPLIVSESVEDNSYLIGNGSMVRSENKVKSHLDLYLDKHKLSVLLPKVDRIWEFFYRNNVQALIDDTTSSDLLVKPLQNITFTMN